MTKKKAKEGRAKKIPTEECIIPPALPKEELRKLVFRQQMVASLSQRKAADRTARRKSLILLVHPA